MNQYPYMPGPPRFSDIGSFLQKVGLLTIFGLGFWLGTQLYPLFHPEPVPDEPTLAPAVLEPAALPTISAQAQKAPSLPTVMPVRPQEVPNVQTVYPGPRSRLVLLDPGPGLGGD